MALTPEPAEQTPRLGLSGQAKRIKSVWLGLLILFGMIAVGLAVYVGVASGFTYQLWGEPPNYEGLASRSVNGEIEPDQTVAARIDVSFDMSALLMSDEVKVELTLDDPSPRAAVFGSFGVERWGETRPALIGESVDVATLDVTFACEGETGRCQIPVDVRLGNVGSTTERWVLTATITHRTGDQDRAETFEVPSLRAELRASHVERDEWVSPGPIALVEDSEQPVAYAVTVETSVNDPALIEVFVTEPWQYRGSRIEAVIGPQNLSWGRADYEPSLEQAFRQAQCDSDGCRLNLVALFRPHQEGDWWIPVVRPAAPASSDLLENTTQISIEQVAATELSGMLGERDQGDNLTLHIDAGPNTPQAAVATMVFPQGRAFEWLEPRLQTDDGQTPGLLRWFDLECSATRCMRDVEVTWNRPDSIESVALIYRITVIGGIGDGLATTTPPSVEVDH